MLCAHECGYSYRPEEGTQSPGASVIDSCEPVMGAGNQTGPLQEQYVFTAESPLIPLKYV